MKLTSFICLLVILLAQGCTMRAPLGHDKGYIRMGKDSIYYESTRPGTKSETVLLLHAGFLNTEMWRKQVPEFSRSYYTVAIDIPGHGRSGNDTNRLRPSDFIKAVMDSLHISKASIIGVSLGASCVTDFIIAHPERVNKAILVASGLNGWEKKFAFDTTINEYISSFFDALEIHDTVKAAEIFTRVWFDGPYRSPAQVNDSARKYIYNTTLDNMRKHHVRGWPIFDEPPAIDRLSGIKMPVLVIHGDKDMPLITRTCTYIEQNIRGAKRVLIPGVGHMLNMENPAKFNEIVLDFLK
ncbi:MAG: alpha/beta hydrolase [Chitinophagaceae bacterium]